MQPEKKFWQTNYNLINSTPSVCAFHSPFFSATMGSEKKKEKAINTPVKFDVCDERDAPRVKSSPVMK